MESDAVPANSCPADERLAAVIAERNVRRGLSLSPGKLAYARSYAEAALRAHGEHVLYVGVGHGLDVLADLADGRVCRATGVDPYMAEAGNDDRDYDELTALIAELEFRDRFTVYRTTVQEYLGGTRQCFSAIVCFDVLHHIFVTEDRLTRSVMAEDAVALFRAFRDHLEPGGVLLLSETERFGLRQMLRAVGVLDGTVNYRTKQPFGEWHTLLTKAGFRPEERQVYIPWALRRWRGVLDNSFGLYTVSDRFIATYRPG